jgi:NAD(P)-dependent dehydrogenase (short-subunit alcohol dehydrogenase family)
VSWSTRDIPSQAGRTAVVTGANGGLGLATAAALAAAGAHVVMAARNLDKADRARERILAVHPEASLEVVPLDLSSQDSVRKAAATVAATHDRIDLLVNNAGVMATPEGRTVDGFETQLATNHLGHWTWTALLLPAVLAAPAGRVVTVTSVAQHTGRALDPDNPHLEGRYDPWRAYGNSKLANLHFALGLDQRLRAAGARASALAAHPGLTHSDLQATTHQAGGAGAMGRFWDLASGTFGMSTEQGALSILRAATDPGATGGSLYGPLWASFGPPVRRPLLPFGTARGIEVLWEVSERETGVALAVPAPGSGG